MNLTFEKDEEEEMYEEEGSFSMYFLKGGAQLCILSMGIFNVLFSMPMIAVADTYFFLLVYFGILLIACIVPVLLAKKSKVVAKIGVSFGILYAALTSILSGFIIFAFVKQMQHVSH